MDYAVKVSVRNGRILRRMRECGIDSQTELARRAGLSVSTVNSLVTLRRAPVGERGGWLHGVQEIAAVLGCDPDDLFTERQRTLAVASNSAEVFMEEERVEALMSGDPEESAWAKIEAQRLLGTLPDRSQRVVEGITAGMTFAEVGDEVGVSAERVRQIYIKSLRQMRGEAVRGDRDAAWKMAMAGRV